MSRPTKAAAAVRWPTRKISWLTMSSTFTNWWTVSALKTSESPVPFSTAKTAFLVLHLHCPNKQYSTAFFSPTLWPGLSLPHLYCLTNSNVDLSNKAASTTCAMKIDYTVVSLFTCLWLWQIFDHDLEIRLVFICVSLRFLRTNQC